MLCVPKSVRLNICMYTLLVYTFVRLWFLLFYCIEALIKTKQMRMRMNMKMGMKTFLFIVSWPAEKKYCSSGCTDSQMHNRQFQ